MKLAWKFTVALVITVAVTLSCCGYSIISAGFHAQLDKQVDSLADETRLLCVTLSALSSGGILEADQDKAVLDVFSQDYFRVYPLSLFNADGSRIAYSGAYTPEISPDDLDHSEILSTIVKNADGTYGIELMLRFRFDGRTYYLDNYQDVTSVFSLRDENLRTYRVIMFCAVGLSLIIGLILSAVFTRPVKKLSDTVHAISGGDYSRRCDVAASDEVGQLAISFNQMADKLADQMNQLEDTAKRQREFTASFAHELKTPMTSIIGYADTMRSRELSQEQRSMAANYIFTEGKRLESMSHALLDLFSMEDGTVTLSPVQTIPVVRSVGTSLEYLLQKRRIVLDVKVENADVMAESQLLKSLLYNLLDNAMKASEPGMKITLCGDRTEAGYQFRVVDRGRGIPPDALARITEPFYMVDKSRSRAEGGAGLGLALCRSIAEVHGTKLEYTTHLGRGTTVSFILREVRRDD